MQKSFVPASGRSECAHGPDEFVCGGRGAPFVACLLNGRGEGPLRGSAGLDESWACSCPRAAWGCRRDRDDPRVPVAPAIAVARGLALRRMLALAGPGQFADLGLHDVVQGPGQRTGARGRNRRRRVSRRGRAAPGRRSDAWTSMVSGSNCVQLEPSSPPSWGVGRVGGAGAARRPIENPPLFGTLLQLQQIRNGN